MHEGAGDRPSQTADSEIRCRIADIMQCRMTGQVDRLMRYFAADVVIHYDCSKEGLFRPGIWKGRDAFRENLRRTDVDYEPLDGEILDVLIEDDKTAVRWRSIWRHRGTGLRYTIDMAHFLKWHGGLVVEMHEFLDHHAIVGSGCHCCRSFEEMLSPRPPGLDRGEIARRAMELVCFPSNGPDVTLIQRLCSPDIVCEFVGDRARIPYAGRHKGLEALVGIVRAIAVDFEQLHLSVAELVVDGGRAAGRRRLEWRHRGTGARGLVDLADFVRFEDGLIVELVEYRDSIALLEMQGEMGGQ